jgi:lipopolysaccharide exporter
MTSQSIASGALLTIAMRWADRLIGLLSTLILARILVPADFGIVAMASIVVAFIDILFDLGVNVALIQKRHPEPSFYDTAWTLRLIQSAVVAAIVFALSDYAGRYYGDPRVPLVVQCMAAGILITALENIGIISFQKNLDFASDFKFTFAKRIVSFAFTIGLTLITGNYWGMVMGAIAGRLAGVVLSYAMVRRRPRLSLRDFSAIFSVSQWVLVRNVSQYLNGNLHVVLVGGFGNAAQTGGYTLANEVSNLPGTELLAPINRVLFPAFVRVKDNLQELIQLLLRAQGIQVLFTAPACVGLALTAHEFVPLVLGEQWRFVVPLIQILALSNIIQAIGSSGNYVLITIGKMRLLAIISWVQIIAFCIGYYAMGSRHDIALIAMIRLGAIGFSLWCTCLILVRNIEGLTLGSLARTAVRPAFGCLAMTGALMLIDLTVRLPLLPAFILKVALGAAVYIAVVLATWVVARKPEGPESYLRDMLAPRLALLARRRLS